MGNLIQKSLGYQEEKQHSYLRNIPKVAFNPKWEKEWLKVVVPGCKASRFRGSPDHPRIDRDLDYALDYFLVGVMLDRWPKPLPLSWVKRLETLMESKKDDKPKLLTMEERAELTLARTPDSFEKKIMDAYYEKRPSKAWLKANVAYIDSLSKADKDFLKAWGMTFFNFVNGKPLSPDSLSVHEKTLLFFIKQIGPMKKNNEMVKRFESFQKDQKIWENSDQTYKVVWQSFGSDEPFNFEETKRKHLENRKALCDWINSHAKLLRQAMKKRMIFLTAKAPPLDKTIIVYRGLKQARTMDSNMRSFSLDYSVARGFGSGFGSSAKDLPSLLRLTLPKGSKMLFIPSTAPLADEMEAIIDMGAVNPKSWTQKWPIYLPSSFGRCREINPTPSSVIVFQGARLNCLKPET